MNQKMSHLQTLLCRSISECVDLYESNCFSIRVFYIEQRVHSHMPSQPILCIFYGEQEIWTHGGWCKCHLSITLYKWVRPVQFTRLAKYDLGLYYYIANFSPQEYSDTYFSRRFTCIYYCWARKNYYWTTIDHLNILISIH